jgi:hypothetical protein
MSEFFEFATQAYRYLSFTLGATTYYVGDNFLNQRYSAAFSLFHISTESWLSMSSI